MKAGNVKGMVLPGLGVGAGMLASPKVAGLHPFLSAHPYLPPIILLFIALALFSYAKARPFALGLGAVALVFLVMSIWSKVAGKVGAPAGEKSTLRYATDWEALIASGDVASAGYYR